MSGRIGKRLSKGYKDIDKDSFYDLERAVDLLIEAPRAKFDETVEIAVRLGVDPRKAEENIRGTVSLPHGTGKDTRIAVFCRSDKVEEAKSAGADIVGENDLIEKVQSGWMEFDVVVATPDVMAKVGRIGKILGPRGLMPNPKVGTVTPDVVGAIKEIKSGRVEFRVEKSGIVHAGVGKISFGKEKVVENINTFIDAVVKAKPHSSKGIYLKSISTATTMGPGVKIDPIPFR